MKSLTKNQKAILAAAQNSSNKLFSVFGIDWQLVRSLDIIAKKVPGFGYTLCGDMVWGFGDKEARQAVLFNLHTRFYQAFPGYKTVSALEVKEGDIVYTNGFRCVVSNVIQENGVARYTLNSAPSRVHNQRLPRTYEGMRSGGNELAKVAVEV